jgi:isopentenyl phosphate kinase
MLMRGLHDLFREKKFLICTAEKCKKLQLIEHVNGMDITGGMHFQISGELSISVGHTFYSVTSGRVSYWFELI